MTSSFDAQAADLDYDIREEICVVCQTTKTPQWRFVDRSRVCNRCYMRMKRAASASKSSRSGPVRMSIMQSHMQAQVRALSQQGSPNSSPSHPPSPRSPTESEEHEQSLGGGQTYVHAHATAGSKRCKVEEGYREGSSSSGHGHGHGHLPLSSNTMAMSSHMSITHMGRKLRKMDIAYMIA